MHHVNRVRSFARTSTARLSLSYLAIIMLMSIGFSIVFYNASSHELGRPPRDDSSQSADPTGFGPRYARDPQFDEFLQQRAEEGRQALRNRLIVLNLAALAAGCALSYYLARRTLQPIEANMEAQAQFVSDASHELRTPLTALQTTNEVALRKPKLSAAEARDLLEHNVAEVAKLQSLTDGLLKLARQDNQPVSHSPVSLQEVTGDAMNTIIHQAQAKDIAIEDNVPPMLVSGDQPSLSQAVVILLDNAVKYSPQGSTVHLSASQQGKYALLAVRDAGQGISAKDLPHIFDRFYRADQSRNKQTVDGYGIGLSMAKKIIDQHHGEIIASSVEGKGSAFTLKLPLS